MNKTYDNNIDELELILTSLKDMRINVSKDSSDIEYINELINILENKIISLDIEESISDYKLDQFINKELENYLEDSYSNSLLIDYEKD